MPSNHQTMIFHPITVALLSEFLIVIAYLFILLVLGWAAAWLEPRAHRSSAAVNCQSGFWWRQAPFLHGSVVFVGGIVLPGQFPAATEAAAATSPGLTGSSTPSASTAGWDGPGARFVFSFRMGWRYQRFDHWTSWDHENSFLYVCCIIYSNP